jgi:hypothetical protein
MKDFKEITEVQDEKVVVQKGNEIWVINCDYKDAEVPMEFWSFCDHDIHAKIKLLGNNKFEIIEWGNLYQFNCSTDLTQIIKLLAMGLKMNGYDVTFIEQNVDTPELVKETVISNAKIIQHGEYFFTGKTTCEVEYSFNFKGKTISGDGTYIKYMFFNDLEHLPDSINELFILVVDLNKLIGKACVEVKNKDFMACEDWVEPLFSKG